MKIKFINEAHLSASNMGKLHTINDIIEEYRAENYTLTLRQLYYQLVSRDIIPNNQKEYSKVGTLLVHGRMAGIVDWDTIEDRIRIPKLPYSVNDIKEAISDTIEQYRLDRQDGQDNYIELWVEKDALSNVLYRISAHYHIRLMVNRGYSSCSAMYDAYNRFNNSDKENYILYLGDHDPSGLDMIQDISGRLNNDFGVDVTIKQIALTDEQIKKYSPPPNPAKLTDPRAKEYIEKYGKTCWEVDALNPKTLTEIVHSNIQSLIDIGLFNAMLIKEKQDIKKMQKILNQGE